MGEHLNVDPVDLHMSSDHMDMHHAELHAAHTSANEAIEGAQAGWVGASAAALQAKFVEWEAATANLTGDIAAHGAAFRAAANGYATGDSESAEKLEEQL
ncbi:MAG: WXG100 family type VII secretion target [Mycobacterium sp.]